MHKFFQHDKYVQFYNENKNKIKIKMKFFTSIVNIEKKIRNFVIVIDFIKINIIHYFENFFNDRISNKKNASYAKKLNVDLLIIINKKKFEKFLKKKHSYLQNRKSFRKQF